MIKTAGRPMDLRKITITDDFWKKEMELVRTNVIPYQWDAINDRVEGAEPSYAMRNFKVAGKITAKRRELGDKYKEITWPLTFVPQPEDVNNLEDRFYGFVFQDSDFSKWIEAVAYSLTQHPDSELEKIADEAIDIVCAAQQDNGYLDTYYIINDISKVFTNLKDYHELYCFGHLTEGAVAYYKATGKDKLMNAARKYADYIDSRFGHEEGQIKGYPGHEIAEMALVRLYEATGDRKYLDLSVYFINERGTRPYYFDQEHPEEAKKHKEDPWYHYYQAHEPVRNQTEAVGHSVRAAYLYSGMADVARLTGDEDLFKACEQLWDNITTKKMYVTGGIGATHIGESFSFNYDLPNDTAYSETCAAIGLVFFARRMLEMNIDSKYSNVMERALYNTVLAGMALDGKSFFYVNPLEVLPEACHKDERKTHVKPVRQKWFGCACCPPNIARTLSSVATYAYSESDDSLFMHLYIGGRIEKEYSDSTIIWNVDSKLPWEGRLKITCESVSNQESIKEKTIAIRIPDWCKSYSVTCGNYTKSVEKGYLYISGNFHEGDVIEVNFDMNVRMIKSNSKVVENIGKVCVSYGPLVYCMEEKDNGSALHLIKLNPDSLDIKLHHETICGNDILSISMNGLREKAKDISLYSDYEKPDYEKVTVKFIPYYTWANRGEGEMSVWVRI